MISSGSTAAGSRSTCPISTGLDRLLADARALEGRKYGLLAHSASVSRRLEPAHLALLRAGAPSPQCLMGPEHGFWGVEQDMVPAEAATEPLTGLPVVSLYGDNAETLRPDPSVFAGLDLLVIDLQDVGARYYTYAATAIWAAEAALAAGCEVWLLDRPNPMGGVEIEGNRVMEGYDSFVGAFDTPVRHGLTMGELLCLEAQRSDWPLGWRVWTMEGWHRDLVWSDLGRPWIAPSPNMPTLETVWVYPGACLVEATQISEGRGTTRPFLLIGAPGLDAAVMAADLERRGGLGVTAVPTFFRPQFQKHAGRLCAGIQVSVTDPARFRPYRFGVDLLAAARRSEPEGFAWRAEAYEFVTDRPAIDLLSGGPHLRSALEAGSGLEDWTQTWTGDELNFREERAGILLYREERGA